MMRHLARRSRERAAFVVERVFLRGAHVRLLAVSLLIALVSFAAGGLVLWLDHGFADLGDAAWWAFLRLSDPGYLGDDEGTLRRTVSTIVTVLGYVLFLGALVAILTQWLNQTITRLQSGLTPIAQRNHVVVLGWTTRTPSVVEELLLSEGRVQRFLRRLGARRLQIAILVEDLGPDRVADLRDRLGALWSERRIVLRSGTPLRAEHLERVDFAHAAVILIPGPEFSAGSSAAADTRTIKTLLSIATHTATLDGARPLVVAEIFDATKVPIACGAYPGPLQILSSDAVIARLLAQNLRHRGLSPVYHEILSHEIGSEIYIRECPGLVGLRLFELEDVFPASIPLGVVRRGTAGTKTILAPPPTFRVESGDRLVFLAPSYEDTAPRSGAAAGGEPPVVETLPSPRQGASRRRVLVLGWSHKVAALLRELDGYGDEAYDVDVFSARPVEERTTVLDRAGFDPERIRVRQLEGDYGVPLEMRRLEPWGYDNVVLVSSDWLETGEESDARTILGWLLLREVLATAERKPDVLIELMDPENVPLFGSSTGEVLISPVVLSHMLAQIALRPDLRNVFDELFGPGGAEIEFRPVREYGLGGTHVTFREIRRAALAHGEIALGVREPGDGAGAIVLNPPRDRRWTLGDGYEVVALTAG